MSPDQEKLEITPRGRSRRRFLRLGAAGLALLVLLPEFSSEAQERSPNDVLTEQELEKAHIKIYQTPDTKLFLRRSAFELPLFRDAKNGKLNRVAIVLVDDDGIGWKTSETFPQEARQVWQMSKSPTQKWFDRKSELEKQVKAQETSGNPMLVVSKSKLKYHLDNRDDWVRREAERKEFVAGLIQGWQIAQARPDFIKDHPELAKSAFVFVAVGGYLAPKPENSYPQPNQLDYSPPDPANSTDGKSYLIGGFSTNLYSLRHEISHYNDPESRVLDSAADTRLMDSISRAWERYSQRGDPSGYPFVFVNSYGTTSV